MSEKKSLFGGLFGGKKGGSGCCNMEIVEEQPGCSCGCCQSAGAVDSIKVLGPGCKNCHALLESVQAALKEVGSAVEVKYVTDMAVVASYGIMSTPGLVINEKVVSTGKVLKAGDVVKLLQNMNR